MKIGSAALFLLLSVLACAHPTPWPTSEWTTADPASQGLDPVKLEELSAIIEADAPTRYSLLIVRNGYLVFERYYHGTHAGQANNIKSISKSILSALTGIAIEEGLLRGVEQKLHEFYPEYFHPGVDKRKFDIALNHLLTMTAGFQWAENTTISNQLWRSSNWLQTMIEFPMASAPGEKFNYNTGLTHLMSGILTKVSGTSTRAYATSRLFDPLGITCYRWTQDPMGIDFGGSEVWLTARDLAKFGLLAARKGRWEDRQIVPAEWMVESNRLRIRTGSQLGAYGYWWWFYTLGGYSVPLASGYGGQNIFVVPDLDLVVVTTAQSDLANQPSSVYAQPYEFMAQYILPAVVGPAPQVNDGGIVNAADYSDRLAVGAFASLFGSGLSLVEKTWDSAMPADGRLPVGVGGVRLRVGERDAYPSWVSGQQVNFLLPSDLPLGRNRLYVLTTRGQASVEINVQAAAPAWFTSLRDGKPIASPGAVPPGAVVKLYASGLGATDPPAPVGAVVHTPLALVTLPEVLIDGQVAIVEYGALVCAGVYQLNVRIPAGLPSGDVVVTLAGALHAAVLEIE